MNIPTIENPPENVPGKWYPTDFDFVHSLSTTLHTISPSVFLLENALSSETCDALISQMVNCGVHTPVGVHGYMGVEGEIGSMRATGWSEALAKRFWVIFAPFFHPRKMNEFTATDWFADHQRKEHIFWKAIGISPLLRFMSYTEGGEHYGHYDMGYDYGDGRRTLMSFVVYLTDVQDGEGGKTRFLQDKQENIPVRHRVHDDWRRRAEEEEILCAVRPQKGHVLFFDHRLCHDVEPYSGTTPRIIIRGDVVYWSMKEEEYVRMENT